ncbi:MAG: sigma-54 dependent transcriptional regulator [Gemmataceae bacterium]|nr:sigma-54 dependent transcriptional regulator [Gemmataceae bacterium]
MARTMQHRILIAEDDKTTRESLKTVLEAENYLAETTGDGKEALEMMLRTSYSVCLTDLRMPGMDGMKLIEEVRRRQLPVTMIVTTGYGSIDEAVKAMRLGALDFLTKPVDDDHLRLVIERALRERGLQAELALMREKLNSQFRFQNVLSKSPRMHSIFEMIQNVAGTAATVLVEGETGTGKEQVARAIHLAAQTHRKGDFVAVNCAAVPENLLESELFGHEKGSFTGAIGQRKGRFEMAHNGTIFLDEVGDIPAAMQVKLLRVLQERTFERVGGGSPIHVDVRVVAATNRGLANLVKKGKFREDLYYRLNVVRLELPPLRERTEDIPLLATHFAHKHARSDGPPRPVSPGAMEKLLGYTWPGNIRELENVIERCCVVARGSSIEAHDLPPELTGGKQQGLPGYRIDLKKPLPELVAEVQADLEKRYIRKALRRTRGNVMRTAKICGLSRRSISAKLSEYGIKKEEFKEKD